LKPQSSKYSRIQGDRVADLPFPMDVKNELVNSGRVSPHHFLPQSGWVSYCIKGKEYIPDRSEVFKKRYDYLKPKMNLVSATTMIDGL